MPHFITQHSSGQSQTTVHVYIPGQQQQQQQLLQQQPWPPYQQRQHQQQLPWSSRPQHQQQQQYQSSEHTRHRSSLSARVLTQEEKDILMAQRIAHQEALEYDAYRDEDNTDLLYAEDCPISGDNSRGSNRSISRSNSRSSSSSSSSNSTNSRDSRSNNSHHHRHNNNSNSNAERSNGMGNNSSSSINTNSSSSNINISSTSNSNTNAAANPRPLSTISGHFATRGLRIIAEPSDNNIPMLFVVTPPLDTSLIPSAFDSFQILIPCQGPSVCSNDAKLVHLTAHSGYTIKVPSNILHNHQGAIRSIGRIFSPVVQGASMASAVSGGPRIPTSSLTSGMTETLRLLGNRNLSDIVGLSLQDMYRVQSLVDSHQQIAMKYLLLSALTDNNQNTTGDLSRLSVYNANGHKFVWVCAECRALLLNGKHIDRSHHTTVEDYKELSKHEKEINVVLKDFVSAKVLTEAIRNSAVAEKVVVRVLPGYFEQRDRRETDPTVFNSICRQFSGLGKALQERPLLTSLEIRCNTITGQLYEGFDQILKCSTLEYLTVIGVPLLLQKDKLLIDCKKLKRLVLDGVLVNTEASAANLAKLIGNATILKALCVSRAAFTPPSLNGLFVDRHQKMQRQLRKLEELALPRNDLDDYGAEKFVSFALKGNSLKALDLRENPSITNDGYQQILECLARQTRQITFDCRE